MDSYIISTVGELIDKLNEYERSLRVLVSCHEGDENEPPLSELLVFPGYYLDDEYSGLRSVGDPDDEDNTIEEERGTPQPFVSLVADN